MTRSDRLGDVPTFDSPFSSRHVLDTLRNTLLNSAPVVPPEAILYMRVRRYASGARRSNSYESEYAHLRCDSTPDSQNPAKSHGGLR